VEATVWRPRHRGRLFGIVRTRLSHCLLRFDPADENAGDKYEREAIHEHACLEGFSPRSRCLQKLSGRSLVTRPVPGSQGADYTGIE